MDVRSLRRFRVATRASLRGVREAPLVFASSVCILAAGLLLLGGYLLLVENMSRVLRDVGEGIRVTAFVDASSVGSEAELAQLAARVRALDGVREVRYVSPAQALERLREELGAQAGVLDGLRRNPLPASFEIELESAARAPERVRALADRLRKAPGISDVVFGEEWVDAYGRVLRAIEWLGLVVGGFIALVLGTIVAAGVRLAVHARSEEIRIQRLVGASGIFVRLPFYLEGALEGALAASIALALLYALFQLGLPSVWSPLEFLVGRGELAFFGPLQVALLLGVGIALGAGGAIVSLVRLEGSP